MDPIDLSAPQDGEAGAGGAGGTEPIDLSQPVEGSAPAGPIDLSAPVDLSAPAPSWKRHLAAFGARLGAPLLGAAAGAAIGTAVGPVGTAAGFIGGLVGGGIGGAAGEAGGRAILGQEQAVAPIATAGALSMIPGIPVKSIPLRALEGAGQGVVATATMSLAEGHGVPGPGELAMGAGAGAGLGLLLRRAFDGKGYWFKPAGPQPVSTAAAEATLTAAQERTFKASGPGLGEAGAQQAADEAAYRAWAARQGTEAERLQAAERSAIGTELGMERALPEPGRLEAPGLHPVELPPVSPGIPRVPGLEHFGQPPVGPVEAGGMPGLGPGERAVGPALAPPFIQGGPARPPGPLPLRGGAAVEPDPAQIMQQAGAVFKGATDMNGRQALWYDVPTPSGPPTTGLIYADEFSLAAMQKVVADVAQRFGGKGRGGLEGDLTRPWVGVKPAIGEQGGPLVVPPSYANPNTYDLTAEATVMRDLLLKQALPAALRGDHATAMDALEAGVRAGVTPPEDVANIRAIAGQPPPRLHAASVETEEGNLTRDILSRIRNCQ